MDILKSKIDNSINYIYEYNKGLVESRFVQRHSDYIAIYLSSHNGCNKACRFCHLTHTKQTLFNEVTHDDYIAQAQLAFLGYDELNGDKKSKITKVHFNFMSRGEPLSNKCITNPESLITLMSSLNKLCDVRGLLPRYNISTIVPKNSEIKKNSFNIHPREVNIYYSLYSLNEDFRRKWIPNAQDPNLVKEYLLRFWPNVRFHWAYIKGENDSIEDTKKIADYINNLDISEKKISIIQYNPPYEGHSVESHLDVITRNIEILNEVAKVKMIQRVGFDVKASCGMFVS